MTQLEEVNVETARRLARVGGLVSRRNKTDTDLIDALHRILESRNPQSERLRKLLKGICR